MFVSEGSFLLKLSVKSKKKTNLNDFFFFKLELILTCLSPKKAKFQLTAKNVYWKSILFLFVTKN